MPSPLENLAGPGGPLQSEAADPREYAALLRAGRERLADAEVPANSLAGRFMLAYDAAHSLGLAALRRQGYRPENRYVVFQALPHSLGVEPAVWRLLSRAHTMRNDSEYRGQLDVNARFVAELIAAVKTVLAALDALPPLG